MDTLTFNRAKTLLSKIEDVKGTIESLERLDISNDLVITDYKVNSARITRSKTAEDLKAFLLAIFRHDLLMYEKEFEEL